MILNWKVSKADSALIDEIAQRAVGSGYYDKMSDALMDITAVHANGNALRLAELASADTFNFAHDVLGIRNKLDRSTGTLTDCFTPRFAR